MTVSKDIALNVLASTAQYQAGVAKIPGITEKEAKRATLAMQKVFAKAEADAAKSATSSAKSVTASLANITIAAQGVVTAAKSMAAAANAVHDWRDQLLDASATTGVTAENLRGMKLAVEAGGGSIEDILPALEKFPAKLREAANNGGDMADAMTKLGVPMRDTGGKIRDADSVVRDLIGKLSEIEDPTQRAAVATDLFGKSGARFVEAFGGGTAQLDAFNKYAEAFGVNVGPQAAAATDKWMRETALLKTAFQGAADALVSDLGGMGTDALRLAGASFVTFSKIATGAIGLVVDWMGNVADLWISIVHGDMAGAVDALRGNLNILTDGMPDLIEAGYAAGDAYLDMAYAIDAAVPPVQRLGAGLDDIGKKAEKADAETAKLQKRMEDWKDPFSPSWHLGLDQAKAGAADLASSFEEEWNAAVTRTMKEYHREVVIGMANSTADIAGSMSDLFTMIAENQQDQGKNVKALWALQKAAALTQIAIQTAVAVMEAAPNPLAMAAMGIAGATQGAVVAAQKPPQMHAGIPTPSSGGRQPNEQRIVVTRHEQVKVEPKTGSMGRTMGGGEGITVVNQYKHRTFDYFVQDNIKRNGPLGKALRVRKPGRSGG